MQPLPSALDVVAAAVLAKPGVGEAKRPETLGRRAWFPEARSTSRLTFPIGIIPLTSTSD